MRRKGCIRARFGTDFDPFWTVFRQLRRHFRHVGKGDLRSLRRLGRETFAERGETFGRRLRWVRRRQETRDERGLCPLLTLRACRKKRRPAVVTAARSGDLRRARGDLRSEFSSGSGDVRRPATSAGCVPCSRCGLVPADSSYKNKCPLYRPVNVSSPRGVCFELAKLAKSPASLAVEVKKALK